MGSPRSPPRRICAATSRTCTSRNWQTAPEDLRSELARRGIALEVVQGAEASLLWALDANDEQLARASYGGRGADLLVETPGQVTTIEQLLYELQGRGLRVTPAHPERSPSFQRVARLVEQGVLLQVNADSLLGHWRRGARRLAL